MIEALRFAWRGPELSIESALPVGRLAEDLRKHTAFKAMLGSNSKIVVALRRHRLSVHRLRNPFIAFGRPVLHAELVPTGSGTRVQGRFSFSTWMQAKFWLLQSGCLFGLGLGIYRVCKAIFTGQPMMDLVAWAFPGIIAALLWMLTMAIANGQVRRYQADRQEISEFLYFRCNSAA